jgi:hypothetical protein
VQNMEVSFVCLLQRGGIEGAKNRDVSSHSVWMVTHNHRRSLVLSFANPARSGQGAELKTIDHRHRRIATLKDL